MLDTASPFVASATLPAAEAGIDIASRRLRRAIVACELAPGDFVHEAALAERFGLGRAGIRVALSDLALSGFVTRHARQGWRMVPVDGALIVAVLDGRRRLEPSLALQQLGEKTRDALIALVGMMESVAGRREPAALATARGAERQLRDMLAAGAGPFARQWLCDIWDHADRIIRALDLAGQHVPPADLRALVDALAAGDAAMAGRAIAAEHQRFADALAHGFMNASAQFLKPRARSARRRIARPDASVPEDHMIPPSKEQQR